MRVDERLRASLSELFTAIERRAADRMGTDGRLRLQEAEVYACLDLLSMARVPCELLPVAATPAQRETWARRAAALAAPDGRLVLKIAGREILHKSEVGGVRVLDEAAPATLLAAADGMAEGAIARLPAGHVEGVLACGFVAHEANQPGQELLLSLRQDAAFGPVVVVGVGGLLTEWYGRGTQGRSRLILPAHDLRAQVVAAALRAHPLLGLAFAPSRLHPRALLDADQVAAGVAALAAAAVALGAESASPWTLEEIEINPAVVSDGRLIAIDGVGLLSRRKWRPASRPLAKISALLAPRSAFVMGASAKGDNPGRVILANLRTSAGIEQGRLAAIHAQETALDGVPCHRHVAQLPWKADLAVVAIPAAAAGEAIAEIVAHDRAESIILIPGGFAESGQADLARAIERTLEEGHASPGGGPVLVGGNCLGIVSRERYNTFFLPERKLRFRGRAGGNLALVSQSGAYLVTFASNYEGVIYPRASISFGNQMDLTVADFLQHFLDDPDVDVVACYVEGFRPGDGARFVAATRQARARGKRVIVYKAGRTALGARAAASHTASLAGDYDIASACLSAAGAVVAASLDEFEDLVKIFTLLHARPGQGRRVGILSNAGFECTAATDALGTLELAAFDASTRAALEACLPPYAHRDNPIDATPIADTEAWTRAAAAVVASPAVDCAILSAVPVTPALDNLPPDASGTHGQGLEGPGSQGRQLIALWEGTQKPLVAVIDSGRLYDPLADQLMTAGVPVFRKIDRATRALAAFCDGET